jgi:hypothetical protein
MTTINESKPVPVTITITIRTVIKAEPSITDLSQINARAADLKKFAAEYGTVEGHILIGKQKFHLAD